MSNTESRLHRKERIRKKVDGSSERPRLTIYKSLKHLHAQVIDDSTGRTLVSASTLSKEIKGKLGDADKKGAAKLVGGLIAEKCKAAKIEKVVFDRNGFPYHGRVAAIADGAREGGLQF
ncbi:MAG: 50S ribosomal protein L18 [Archangium gephyra]|uniref:Large ribosomal subunit protein uL18 n=1 Tax=Archangium gephyra TaxID=48 RepID=A0A2W5VHS9_9BACT|nr:MAG: 50S ribosomal protein L18 [Archangium gephyra]